MRRSICIYGFTKLQSTFNKEKYPNKLKQEPMQRTELFMKDQSFSTVDAATDEREDIIRLEAVVSVLFNPMVDCMKCKCKLM